jgi:hypothetical protein
MVLKDTRAGGAHVLLIGDIRDDTQRAAAEGFALVGERYNRSVSVDRDDRPVRCRRQRR